MIPLAWMILNRYSGACIVGSPFPARICQMRPARGKCFQLSGPMDQNHRDNFRIGEVYRPYAEFRIMPRKHCDEHRTPMNPGFVRFSDSA